MKVKRFKELLKNIPGNTLVVVHIGGGVYQELTGAEVFVDTFQAATYDDEPALFLGGPDDEKDKPNP